MKAHVDTNPLTGMMGRPEEATQRHLADAIKVRDRLLTIVETPALATAEEAS